MTASNNDAIRADGNKPAPGYKERLLGFFPLFRSGSNNSQQMHIPFLRPSYADQFEKFSQRTPIDDRKDEMTKILNDYANEHEEKKKEANKKKINKTMVKLFNKLTPNRDTDGYFRCVSNSHSRNDNVEPWSIYQELLFANEKKEHPNGISGLAFAFAWILAQSSRHDLPNQRGVERNSNSPCFDLPSLYGTNEKETDTMRLRDGHGMIWPDCFIGDRLDTTPAAVSALLILWNRYHNYVAKQLLWHNENDKWTDPSILSPGSDALLKQDNEIFKLARTITSINFVNVIREDFLKGLLGLPFVGPSVGVDILYDAAANVGMPKDSYHPTIESHFLYDFSSLAPPSIAGKLLEAASGEKPGEADQDVRRRNYIGLCRNKKGYLEDNDLMTVLLDASESSAGAPGANGIEPWARERVVQGIKQARNLNVCTLNEFRVYLGLKPLKSFEEWNSNGRIAKAAEELYEKIDNLELYPGLLAEESMGHEGFRFGRTMTWGLISDIVTRIRSDPLLMGVLSDKGLTTWGFNDCVMDTENARGSFGSMMPKLLARTLPRNYTFDNTYLLFPFSTPRETKNRLVNLFPEGKERGEKKYDFDRPKRRAIKVLRTVEAISTVFNDPERFRTPYKRHLEELTDGYGHMLGFDGFGGDLSLHDQDLMLTLFSLLPDKGAAKRIGATFAQRANENFVERSTKLSEGSDQATIDVIRDLIDATCIRWVCEIIYAYDLPGKNICELSPKERQEAIDTARVAEAEVHDDFAAFYAYVFPNAEPETAWAAREKAHQASEKFQTHLEKKLGELREEKSDAYFWDYLKNTMFSCKRIILRIAQEYRSKGNKLPKDEARTFLDRMMTAAEIAPLKYLESDDPDLKKFRELHLKEGMTEEEEKDAWEKMEKKRVIANVIALAFVISVHFSKVCSQVVDFYMNDKYKAEREALIKVCQSDDKESSNKDIMGYVREAQRIGQRFGLWRDAVLPSVIKQGPNYPDLTIESGDRVFADFTGAHNDPREFNDPDKVILGRDVKSLQGLGVHKCPAKLFIDETMSEMIRVIFGQSGNPPKRPAQGGQLKVGVLHPDASPWDHDVFMDEGGVYSSYPKKLVLQFNAADGNRHEHHWEFNEGRFFNWINIILSTFFAIIALFFFLKFIMFLSGASSFDLFMPTFGWSSSSTGSTVGQSNTECGNPLTDVEPWHIDSFRPKWFGLFGEPAPIIYRTPRGRKAHQFSLVDIDKRDIEIRLWVDNEDRGSRHVDIDPTVNCGENLVECLNLGFGAALVYVPPGRHTVKAEIVKRNGTFEWGKERRRRIMWTVQRCP